ncbi:MAG: hypothetical protein AAFX06_16375 [Planctomycetota bacterium]
MFVDQFKGVSELRTEGVAVGLSPVRCRYRNACDPLECHDMHDRPPLDTLSDFPSRKAQGSPAATSIAVRARMM